MKLVPLFRHSTLPELKRFVDIFRPERLVPNFLEPKLHGIDWACMPYMFGPHMAAGGEVRIREEMVAAVPIDSLAAVELDDVLEDVERSNLEGGNETTALDALADKWAPALGSEKGLAKIGRTIERLKGFLPKGIGVLVNRMVRTAAEKALPDYYADKEEEENHSSDDEDDGGAMAEWLFMASQDKRQTNNDDGDATRSPARTSHANFIKSSNARSPKSPKLKRSNYSSPRSQRRAGVLTEQTNIVKAEAIATDTVVGEGGQRRQSQSQSQKAELQTKARYEHKADIAYLEKILREREQMTFKSEPLSPPPTLKRPRSPAIESQTVKRSCPTKDTPRDRPIPVQNDSNERQHNRGLGQEEASQLLSSGNSRDRIKPALKLRTPAGGFELPDTRFRRRKRNSGDEMDWDRARALEQLIVCELRAGRKPKMPELNCTAGRWGSWTRF